MRLTVPFRCKRAPRASQQAESDHEGRAFFKSSEFSAALSLNTLIHPLVDVLDGVGSEAA
jgi:hypothetical protein